VDLQKMNLDELKALLKEVTKTIETYEARQIAAARADLEERARAHGLTLKQILSEDATKKTRVPAKVKYQNPADPEEKWTGRGRKPKWLTAQLQEGANLEDFAV
jgi:DNA-binding protein H-NS